MSITSAINGNFTVTDTLNNAGVQLVFQFLQNVAITDFSYLRGFQVPASPTSITFPFGISLVQACYVRNVGLINNVTVTWTPNGGSTNPVITLTPNSAIMFLEADLTKGISALSLASVTAPTNVDLVIAG